MSDQNPPRGPEELDPDSFSTLAGSNESVVNDLSTLLERERTRLAALARLRGLPASIPSPKVLGTLTETGASYQHVEVQRSSYGDFSIQRALDGRWNPELKDSFLDLAARLLAKFHDGCHRWNATAPGVADGKTPERVVELYLRPLRFEYLEGLTSLDLGDTERLRSLAEGLVEELRGKTVTFVTCLPVGGVEPEGESLQSGAVRLRRLTAEELGERGRMAGRFSSLRSIPSPWPDGSAGERWAVEVRRTCSKSEQPGPNDLMQRVLLACCLDGFEPHGSGTAATWTEPGPSWWKGGQRFQIAHRGRNRTASLGQLDHVVEIADAIDDGSLRNPAQTRDIALHRFQLGSSRSGPADALIDFVISLEALLLAGATESELSYQFRLRGSWFLGRDRAEREELMRGLNRVYRARSKLVHGSIGPTHPDVAKFAEEARELAARMILRAVKSPSPWPTREFWNSIVLGD